MRFGTMVRIILIGSILIAGCDQTSAPPPRPTLTLPDGPPVRVLFLGNSLTATHELPALVQSLAAAGGVRLEFHAITPGDTALQDHWKSDKTRKLLTESKWDFVVLQQGPSSQPESRANLKEYVVKWADEIRAHGAKPAVYMVWPLADQPNGYDLVTTSYREAAEAGRAKLLPAGEAWRASLRLHPEVKLTIFDGLHPTPAGTYLAALVLAHGLAGVSPKTAPARLILQTGNELELSEDQAQKLREAAAEVCR